MDSSDAWRSIRETARDVSTGRVGSAETTELVLARAESLGRDLRAFIVVDRAGALAAARRADAAVARGRSTGPLHGVPITVKDLILTRGIPTTAGSRALTGEFPTDRDAAVVETLRRAGAVIVGKTQLNEFAFGVTGANHHFGQVENPWDRSRMSGGSSSGSAAAVAAGIGYGSVGTDTRGSIRIPASCCGVTGFKPTRDLVSTAGVFPLSWTLDHVGPLARSVDDAALLLQAIVGNARAWGAGSLRRKEESASLRGLRLGICDYFFRDVDAEVEGAVREAVAVLVDLGARPVEVEIPELDDALSASAVLVSSEALAVHHDRMRERSDRYDPDVLARLRGGYELSALDLARAHRVRLRLSEAYQEVFRRVDAMVGPTLPAPPPRAGATEVAVGEGRLEPVVSAWCRLTSPQNMTGAPALSVPCGRTRAGLPVGLQIWTAVGDDAGALAVGRAYQRATGWHRLRPPSSPEGAG